MPGRIRAEDLPRSLRAKLVDRATRPAPPRTRSTSQPAPEWYCPRCGHRTRYLSAIERHCGDTGHYRYTDEGLGL